MKKVDYKHGRFVLVDTDPFQFEYESYEDWCDINDEEPQGEDSEDFYNWCEEESANQFNEDMDNIRCCKEYNVPCLINGSLGLWWGKPTIAPVRCESVYDAVKKCMDGNYDKQVEVAYNDGKIEVKVAHHDGTNVFTITALSKKGINKVGDDYKPHDIKRLPYLYAIGI
jgi:hypothetical protein